MSKWVALLRGINVGGRNKLPMKDLLDIAQDLDWRSAKTYIQSGNMVFEADAPEASSLAGAIEAQCGFRPLVILLSAKNFTSVLTACPYESATGKDVHIYFLDDYAGSANREKLEHLKAQSEDWQLTENAFYLFAPDGVARSKLASGAEAALGVQATARNWNTVQALAKMLGNQ